MPPRPSCWPNRSSAGKGSAAENGGERRWDAGRPVDLLGTLGPLRRGTGDPAHRVGGSGGFPTAAAVAGEGTFWWACETPDGAGTLALQADGPSAVSAHVWGAGADWLLARVPALLGDGDDWSALDVSGHPKLHELLRRRVGVLPAGGRGVVGSTGGAVAGGVGGLRLPATGLVLDSLVPAVLEQRVTGPQARAAWRGLLHRFGTAAPGPRTDLRVPPSPRTLLDIPTWEWHRLGVDSRRQRAIRAAATVAPRLEECVAMSPADALARLRAVPGVGEWTAAETAQRALGHPDAVSVGDYHIHDVVVHFLTGRPRGTDAEMLALLAPWTGQRQRIVRLIECSGIGAPRFGPRLAPLDIRAI